MGIYLRHDCSGCKSWRRNPGSCICGGEYAPSFYYIEYRVAGKLKTEKAGTLSRARNLLKKREAQPHQSFRKISEVAELYFQTRPIHVQQYENIHWQRLNVFENYKLCDLSRGDILEYIKRRQSEKNKHGRPSKDTTLDREINVLKRVWAFASSEGWVHHNPFKNLGLSTRLEPVNKYLYQHEWEMLYKALPLPTRDYYFFLWQTAARSMEAANLTWSDIDLDRKIAWVIGKGKGARREVLYLSNAVCEMLAKRHGEGTVFVNYKGEQISCPREMLIVRAERCGLNKILQKTGRAKINGPHYLRHAAISRWVMQGEDLAVVAKLARHTNIQMTMRYTHLAPERLHSAVNKL